MESVARGIGSFFLGDAAFINGVLNGADDEAGTNLCGEVIAVGDGLEEAFDAAVREVREETTLTDLAFDWGHSFLETGPYNRGKVARYYLAANRTGAVSLPVNPELGRPEHNEFRWVDYREALSLISPRLVPVLNWAGHILHI